MATAGLGSGMTALTTAQQAAARAAIGAAPVSAAGNANTFWLVGDSRNKFFNDLQGSRRNVANNSLFAVANRLAANRAVVLGTSAVPGQRLDEQLAAFGAATASGAANIFVCGVVNDLAGQNLPAGRTAEAIFADLRSMHLQARAVGARLWVCDEPGSTTLNAGQLVERNKFNSYLRKYADSNGDLILVPIASTLLSRSSATVAFKAGYAYDSTHWTAWGCYVAGRDVLAPLMRQHLRAMPSVPVDVVGAGYIGNPGLLNTSGGTAGAGATGPVPASWSVSRSGGTSTVTVSVQADTSGDGLGNEIVLACAFGGADQRIRCQCTIDTATAGIVPGTTIQAGMEIDILSGATALVGASLMTYYQVDGGASVEWYDMHGVAAEGGLAPTSDILRLPLISQQVTIAAGTTLSPLIIGLVIFPSAAGVATVRLRAPWLHKSLALPA